MGTIIGDLYDHEGYAARRLPDGTLTASWTYETREFTGYVAACSCATGRSSWTDWYGSTDHPPTDEGEQAAIDEWERVHARPLLERKQVTNRDTEAAITEALYTAGFVDADGGPDVQAIVGTWWHLDGPHTPERIASAALAVDELVHYLARATAPQVSAETLEYASYVYRLITELRSGLGRLDQVLDQTSTRMAAIAAAGRLTDDRYDGRDPVATAREAQGGLDAARVALGQLLDALGTAHRASGHLGHE